MMSVVKKITLYRKFKGQDLSSTISFRLHVYEFSLDIKFKGQGLSSAIAVSLHAYEFSFDYS